jgi:hypothetical protein
MDVIGTDAFMATQLAALGVDKLHGVRLFSAKTASLRAFCEFLRNYLENTAPANRPSITVFVLPSQSVKEKAWRLFFDLGAAARELDTGQYAEVYGFDDGNMPRYELRQYPGRELPFFGLQEVEPIKLGPRGTKEEILKMCRERCNSDHFVIIDEYRPIKKSFLVDAEIEADAGADATDGYRIYAKKA